MVGNGIAETTDDTFIKWLNDHLAKATPPLLIYDLTEDNVCNGVAIGLLLEIIGGIKIDGLLLQPITIVERLHNIHEVFSVLRRLNVKLNNIQPEDVMGGDKETVLQLLVAINDHFIPTVKGRKLFSSHDADYKIDTSGRTSAWSAVSGSTRRTPISQSQSINMNGSHENGGFHHSHKNLHLTNGRDTPHTDLPWSNSSDHFIDSQQPYSYQPLAATPTPSEISGCTSPRSKSTVYRARSDPLSPRYSHGKREIFASTTPINIKSALPNLSSGSRGYYPPSTPSIPRSTAPSYQHDKNAYGLRSGRSTAEVPQLFDSMNEIQHLKSQLNMLSKLIEPDGPSGVRAASVFHSTASKSTQTDLGYLLDRQAKKSNAEITELRSIIKIREETIQQLEEENARLSDSLKTILHNMNKPGNIDKNTMSNSLPIVGQNHSDKTAYKNPSTAASIRPYDDRIQQQQLRQPYPTTPSANQPSMMISPSQKCYMMSRALDYPPVRSSSPSRPENSESSFSTTRTKNRQKSPEKHGKNIKRQLSPTGKRFPHYQPYIHSLMHPDQLLKSDNYKNSNDSKSLSVGLTATQAQIIKSPTQRLLMQSLPTSGYY